jgi:phospholipid/cholesterol/gamma-HCH transport system substrate-binding protein
LQAVDHGDGYASRLLHDPKEADNISKALNNMESMTRELELAARGISAAVVQLNSGPGFAHDLLYGQEGTRAVAQVGEAAGELATTLHAIREGDGIMKGVLFGGEGTADVLTNLNAASSDLRGLMAGLKAGKGTLGALLVDPSVYEDVKLILGNVQRNDALRSLVRYSIKQGEAPNVEVTDPTP